MGGAESKIENENNETLGCGVRINGVFYPVDLSSLPADTTLNTFIRQNAQLTATKFMCLEGGCGACVCAVRRKDSKTGVMTISAVNSCLTLLNSCLDCEIITSEGIGNKQVGYHPIQTRLAKMNGTQCGYCSPGFVMNMYALLESKNQITMEEVENSFGGNICRCTGYRSILAAMKSFSVDSTIEIPKECQQDIEDLVSNKNNKTCPKTGEACAGGCQKSPKKLTNVEGVTWHWPKDLEELFEALDKVDKNEKYMLVAGNTAHGVYRRPIDITHYIDLHGIAELKKYSIHDNLTLGGNISLTEAMDVFMDAAKKPGFEYCEELWKHFDLIANVPVRNSGTLAGNLTIKKEHPEFPSDVFITLEALDAQLVVNDSVENKTTVPLLTYLTQANKKVVITAIILKPFPKNRYTFKTYKIMPRAQNAHAYVNAAFLIEKDPTNSNIIDARLCFGGINPCFVHLKSVENFIKGQSLFARETITKIFELMVRDIQPDNNLPDSSPEYRTKLACGLFYKFLLNIAPTEQVKAEYKSGGELIKRELSSGMQSYETIEKNYPVTKPVPKIEGLIQCSGEATYMNDTLTVSNTLYCAFVSGTKVGATIERIDATDALKMTGVVAFYSAKDVPGENTFCDPTFGYDVEEIFCADYIKFYDQPIGVIVATTNDYAQRATSAVKVIYSSTSKVLRVTMSDVLTANETDRVETEFDSLPEKEIKLSADPDITGRGIFEIGLQYHFAMEPQTAVVVPFEDGLQVWSATQWMDQTQSVIAKMLKIKTNSVQLKVRRLGGAYGCKITRGNPVACAAALAAYKLNRPVRFVQSIESMMNILGKRWACRSDYEFHIKANGKIVGLTHNFFEDAGYTHNESPVADLSTICAKNCYDFTDDNLKLKGSAVLTDAPSNTWCRAPGSVEGIAMIENILEHIAFEAKIDPADARMVNIKPGNKMLDLLPRFLKSTEYRERRAEIDTFNGKNRWRKRGLGLAIMEYPLHYFGEFPTTVSIYHTDGTVVISHGGIEMGQGMNTKIAQVAAYVLGIPLEFVKIEASDTINGANSMVTGGSVGSESVCFAVRKACETLNARLKPIKEDLGKDATWPAIVNTAWAKSILMIATDHYKEGDMQNYNIYGLGLTEIEIDILTGNNKVRRVDILEDTGESLSPLIDIGQIEGAFVMCLGYCLSEELIYDRQIGKLLTNRTWNYKPPGAKDIPIDFRIELLQNTPNPAGFMRSKASGEPPCCLAISVLFAIQHALQSARNDAGLKREWIRLGAPTTPETVVLNAGSVVESFSLE